MARLRRLARLRRNDRLRRLRRLARLGRIARGGRRGRAGRCRRHRRGGRGHARKSSRGEQADCHQKRQYDCQDFFLGHAFFLRLKIIANSCHWMLEFHASRRVRIQHCHRITRSSIFQAHFGQNIRFLYRFVHAGVPPPRPALSSPPHSPEHAHRRSCRFGLTHGCAYTYNKPRHRPDARRRCRFDAGTM